MSQKLDDLKYILGQGARANKYQITINGPVDGTTLDTLCQAASLPAKTVGTIPVFNQGRKLLIAGDTSFDNTWDVTFYNDEVHSVRTIIQAWMDMADNFIDNNHAASPSDYMYDADVSQLDGNDNATGTWKIYNLYPTNISAVDLGDETADTITTFVVTFTYSHWEKVA